MAESSSIYSSRSRRPVGKLLDTPSCVCGCVVRAYVYYIYVHTQYNVF